MVMRACRSTSDDALPPLPQSNGRGPALVTYEVLETQIIIDAVARQDWT
jgi:hypothetical protein